MRRKDREVTDISDIISIIDSCEILRIGLADGDFPYIVPVNFAYTVKDGRISFYIHGAIAGRKYELLNKNGRCSFELDVPLGMECLLEHGDITERYYSVMGTADVTLLPDDEKKAVMDDIILARDERTRNFPYDAAKLKVTMIARLDVTSISGKANKPKGGPD